MSKIVWVDNDIDCPEFSIEREEFIDNGHELKCFSSITNFINYFKIKSNIEEYDGIIIDMFMNPEEIFDKVESGYGSCTGLLLIEAIKKIPNFKNSEIIIYSIIDSQDLKNKYPKLNVHFLGKSEVFPSEFVKEVELIINSGEKNNKQIHFEPFDIVIYKPTGERGLVKKVTEDGVFVLFRIQSTAQLCKFEDLELE